MIKMKANLLFNFALKLFLLQNYTNICFCFKKTNKEISNTRGEKIYLFFKTLLCKLSFGQRPRQCLNKKS